MEILYNESDDYLVDSIFYLFKVTILYYIVSYCNVLCYVMLFHVISCYVILFYVMLYYFGLYCYKKVWHDVYLEGWYTIDPLLGFDSFSSFWRSTYPWER